jgi:hypothetical protein
LSSDTALDHRGVYTLTQVCVERHQRQVTEILGLCPRRRGVLACNLSRILQAVPDFEKVAGKLLFGKRGIIDLDAFARKAEVRGSVETDLVKTGRGFGVLGEDRGDKSRSRALSLGSCDVDGI